jgi:hypothetical protein
MSMVFFRETHVFLHLSLIGLFGTKFAFLSLENPNGHAEFNQKQTQFSQDKIVQHSPDSNLDGILSRDTCGSSFS